MLKLSSLKANLPAQYQPEWVDYPVWEGVRFHVVSVRLPAYVNALEAAGLKMTQKYKGRKIPLDEARAIDAALFCEHLLRGWDGIDQDYSPELAEKLLSDLEYLALYDAAIWCARSRAAINAEFVKDLTKNSVAPSATA